jgi:hypothetical protein
MEWTQQVFTYCPFTPAFNSTGQPAISLPLHWSTNGLPIGVQFVGHFGDEGSLLRLGGAARTSTSLGRENDHQCMRGARTIGKVPKIWVFADDGRHSLPTICE